MYESYKKLLESEDTLSWIEWAETVKKDDIETFKTLFDPSDDAHMFDPIELAIAYDAERIFHFLISTYDYSDFYNQVDFSLLILLLIFEHEHFLLMALESFEFPPEHYLHMYEYIITHKDVDYFKQFYRHYPVAADQHKDLLRLSLNNHDIFLYLSGLETMEALLRDEDVMFDIISFHPQLLALLVDVEDVRDYIDTELFMNVLQLENLADFKKVLAFLLNRGWDINEENDFGLTLFHQALRYAKEAGYVEMLVTFGADTTARTSMGFPPAHQLLLRDSQFTLALTEIVDFNARDNIGYTLQDYDAMMREESLNHFDILNVVKLILNMDESYLYELSEDDFYHLAALHGIEVFAPYITLLSVESPDIKERYRRELSEMDFSAFDIIPLKDLFPGKFPHDINKTLHLELDFLDITETKIEHFKTFAAAHDTILVIESEGEALNHRGQIVYEITPSGDITKKAVVYSHLVDVYYLNYYYEIPLVNITYRPDPKKPMRFLN